MDLKMLGAALLQAEPEVQKVPAPFIQPPFRALVAGESGSGKTFSFLTHVILPAESGLSVVIWCSPSASLQQSKLRTAADIINARDGCLFVPVPCDDGVIDEARISHVLGLAFADGLLSIVVFDDLVSVKPASRRFIASMFMNARHQNASVAELRQRVFSSDGSSARDARLNCNLFMLGRFSSDGEVATLANQLTSNAAEKDLLVRRYRKVTAKKHGFILIDLQAPRDSPYRFRDSGLTTLFKPA